MISYGWGYTKYSKCTEIRNRFSKTGTFFIFSFFQKRELFSLFSFSENGNFFHFFGIMKSGTFNTLPRPILLLLSSDKLQSSDHR